MCVRAECLMRVAITLKQNTFYKPVCSKKNLTGGTLMGVWTCTNLPPLNSTLFAKINRQTWLAFLDIALKQGIFSECISIHMQWHDTLDLKFFCFGVFEFGGVFIVAVWGFICSFFLSLMVQNLLLFIILFLIWPSVETDDWGKLGSWRIQMLNSRINFSSRGIWESDPLPWLSWQLGLTPSNPKGSFLC